MCVPEASPGQLDSALILHSLQGMIALQAFAVDAPKGTRLRWKEDDVEEVPSEVWTRAEKHRPSARG